MNPPCISSDTQGDVRVTKTMRGTGDTLTGPWTMLNRGSLGRIDIPRPDTGVISVVMLDARGSVQTGDWITVLLIICPV